MSEEKLESERFKAKERIEKLRENEDDYNKEIRHEDMKDRMNDIKEKRTEEERERENNTSEKNNI